MSIITIAVGDDLVLVSRYEIRSIGPLSSDSDSQNPVMTNCESRIGLKRNNGCS